MEKRTLSEEEIISRMKEYMNKSITNDEKAAYKAIEYLIKKNKYKTVLESLNAKCNEK